MHSLNTQDRKAIFDFLYSGENENVREELLVELVDKYYQLSIEQGIEIEKKTKELNELRASNAKLLRKKSEGKLNGHRLFLARVLNRMRK